MGLFGDLIQQGQISEQKGRASSLEAQERPYRRPRITARRYDTICTPPRRHRTPRFGALPNSPHSAPRPAQPRASRTAPPGNSSM